MDAKFFATPTQWRKWLERNHDNAAELWVGFYKRDSGRPSVTWPQAVDQALCFGWIDGIRKRIDEVSYRIRFTPRRTGSVWSAINAKKVEELSRQGLMHPAGLDAFGKLDKEKSRIYSYEQRNRAKLAAAQEQQFRANRKAWEFFQKQPPWYQRTATFWVVSAKKEETRTKRLATLIASSAEESRIAPLRRNPT